MNELLTLFQTVGVPLGLVVVFVWQGMKREERLSSRLGTLEDWARTTMQTTLTSLTLELRQQRQSMHARPCLMKDPALETDC